MNKKQSDILNDYFLHSALHMLTLEEQCLKKLCARDLSVRELHVIEAVSCLSAEGKNTMAEIAKYLYISPASLTSAANVLVKKGYLRRHISEDDKRVAYLSLSERGERANEAYLSFVRSMISRFGEGLDEECADKVIDALIALGDSLKESLI